ncbi:MAG TPA: hypothetical protein VK796_09140 [Cytophaga sp.]|jgi:hypothetical protein|nr:hypothetical protein [Cytophaga sp.]
MKYIITLLCGCVFFTFTCLAQKTTDASASNNVLYFSIWRQSAVSIHYERIFRINQHLTINPHVGTGCINYQSETHAPVEVTLYHGLNVLFGIKNLYVESGVDYVVHDYGHKFYYTINGNFGLRYKPSRKKSILISLTYNPIFYRSAAGNGFDTPYGFSVGLAF